MANTNTTHFWTQIDVKQFQTSARNLLSLPPALLNVLSKDPGDISCDDIIVPTLQQRTDEAIKEAIEAKAQGKNWQLKPESENVITQKANAKSLKAFNAKSQIAKLQWQRPPYPLNWLPQTVNENYDAMPKSNPLLNPPDEIILSISTYRYQKPDREKEILVLGSSTLDQLLPFLKCPTDELVSFIPQISELESKQSTFFIESVFYDYIDPKNETSITENNEKEPTNNGEKSTEKETDTDSNTNTKKRKRNENNNNNNTEQQQQEEIDQSDTVVETHQNENNHATTENMDLDGITNKTNTQTNSNREKETEMERQKLYSEVVIDWTLEGNRFTDSKVGIYSKKKMEGTRFDSLTICIGKPYLFVHHGDCKHKIVFSDLRLMTSEDHLNRNVYPKLIWQHRTISKRCKICDVNSATLVTFDDLMVSESPCYFCAECFGRLHYTHDHKLVQNSKFKLFAYKYGRPLPFHQFFEVQNKYNEDDEENEQGENQDERIDVNLVSDHEQEQVEEEEETNMETTNTTLNTTTNESETTEPITDVAPEQH